MRSIRRSTTAYLLILLGFTLAAVWLVIDRVTARAISDREAAGADLIQARYEDRCRDELVRVDDELLNEARQLGNIMQHHYRYGFPGEWFNYSAHLTAGQYLFAPAPAFGSNLLPTLAWTATGYTPGSPGRPNLSSRALFRMYFANLPLPDELIQNFEETSRRVDYFQINTGSWREWHSRSLAGRKLAFDPKEVNGKSADPAKPIESSNLIDWAIGDATIGSDHEKVRRVLYKAPYFNASAQLPGFGRPRPLGGRDDRRDGPGPQGSPGGSWPFAPPQPRSMLGMWGSWVNGVGPAPPGLSPPTPVPPSPSAESLPRLYVQAARPQAAIDETLATFAAQRDADLATLAVEIRNVRQTLRARIAGISLAAFLALAVGGPLAVGRGLRPVDKLSDAVSRVSEKDFKLPHDGTDLPVELAPIHARLTQTLALLRRAFSREKQAVADISHELRTPIAALMATIDVALRKPRTPDQYRNTLEECKSISRQLGQLVERIMTLASLDSGNDHPQVERTDAADLAAGCAAVIRPLAAANSISIELDAPGPLELDTDAGKLREVLMNLLHNAVEYNTPNGVIEMIVRREGPAVVFEVRDTGIGMTAEIRERIFERFFRADPSRHSTGVHAGLGLAIVREYVDRLGATIAVESESGVGSTFRVAIPAPDPDLVVESPPRGTRSGVPRPVVSRN